MESMAAGLKIYRDGSLLKAKIYGVRAREVRDCPGGMCSAWQVQWWNDDQFFFLS